MLEPIELATAPIFPHCCLTCRGTEGPFLDTHVETVEGRVYLCKRCIATYARIFGLVRGKKMNELLEAHRRADKTDEHVAALQRRLDETTAERDALARERLELLEELDSTKTTLAQARTALEERAAHMLDLAKGGV